MNVAIIGGGISGLSLAYYLKRMSKPNSLSIFLYETNSSLGGWINSTTVDDFGVVGERFNFGPKSIRFRNPKIPALFYMLNDINGINKLQISHSNSKASNGRYIFSNHKLNRIGPRELIYEYITPAGLFPLLYNDVIKSKNIKSDISVHEFFSNIFSYKVVENVVNPIMTGIYATNCKNLSLQFCLDFIWKYSNCRGGILRYLLCNPEQLFKNESMLNNQIIKACAATEHKTKTWRTISTYNGKDGIINLIQKALTQNNDLKINIFKNSKIKKIKFAKNNGTVILKIEKSEHEFDHVFSTISSYELANLIIDEDRELSLKLASIRYSSVACVILEYPSRELIDFKLTGFGFLVPAIELSIAPVIGVIFDSNLFNNSSSTIFTILLGGDHFENYFGEYRNASKDKILLHSINVIRQVLNIKLNPTRHSVRILENCLPIPGVNHFLLLSDIQSSIMNYPFDISGAAISGPAIPDIVHHSLKLSNKFLTNKNLLDYKF
ncbi:hypothetical protein HZS_6223, partial [Henneguya salminicola]